jgi:hypothetical protein
MEECMPASIDSEAIRSVRAILKKEKVFTLERLMCLLDCSRRTAQTRLSQWETYTSYNRNSRYYALPNVPRFDVNGLWRSNNIAFSKHGNLKRTIIHLINSSESGLTGKELGDLLGLSTQSFVHHFRDCPGICREKHGGVYIHFSDQPDSYKQQVRKRIAALLPNGKGTISEADTTMILVAIIKHHGISAKEILALPEVKQRGLSESAIQSFLQSHGLLKKTPDIRP